MKRMTVRERRERSEMRKGWMMIAAAALAFAGMIAGAYAVDQAQGVTVAQSLSDWGL